MGGIPLAHVDQQPAGVAVYGDLSVRDGLPPRPGGVWRVVASLPPRQREAVALRYVADLDHAGIARAMDTSVTMSRRLVSDALVTLRKALT